jgi:hypothetical protein
MPPPHPPPARQGRLIIVNPEDAAAAAAAADAGHGVRNYVDDSTTPLQRLRDARVNLKKEIKLAKRVKLNMYATFEDEPGDTAADIAENAESILQWIRPYDILIRDAVSDLTQGIEEIYKAHNQLEERRLEWEESDSDSSNSSNSSGGRRKRKSKKRKTKRKSRKTRKRKSRKGKSKRKRTKKRTKR